MLHGYVEAPAATAAPARRPAWIAALLAALAGAFVYWLVVVFPRAPA